MYTALKPCSFAGEHFKIGDTIPDGLVQAQAITRLKNGGFIAEAGAGPLLPATASIENTVAVPILADEGEAIIDMTVEDLLAAVKAIQMPDEELLAEIETIESGDVLILIDIIRGSNEAIHEAAKAKALAEEASADEIPTTEYELMRLRREQLAGIAEGYGMEVTEEHTKKMLTAYILEAQKEA